MYSIQMTVLGSNSVISICCGLVVQQVVRLAVQLADCCTTCCESLLWIGCEFVVLLAVHHVLSLYIVLGKSMPTLSGHREKCDIEKIDTVQKRLLK